MSRTYPMRFSSSVEMRSQDGKKFTVAISLRNAEQDHAQDFADALSSLVRERNRDASNASRWGLSLRVEPEYDASVYLVKIEIGNIGLIVAQLVATEASALFMLINDRVEAAQANTQTKPVLIKGCHAYGHANKVQSIKALRGVTALGLKEAKDMVEAIMDGTAQVIQPAPDLWTNSVSFDLFHQCFVWAYTG